MVHLKHNKYNELHRKDCETSPSVDSMMREVLHMLGNIDFEHDVELGKVERNLTAHRERLEPYVELLAQLRLRQLRLSLRH